MIRYGVRDLHALLMWVNHEIVYTHNQEHYRSGNDALLNLKEQERVKRQIGCVEKHCRELEAVETVTACEGLSKRLSQPMTLGECRGHLIAIREMVTEILQNRVFMYVPLRVSKYAQTYQSPMTRLPEPSRAWEGQNPLSQKPFGSIVFNVFSGARFDAEQVSLCMVAGASTAAVFHMMRVVEHGVRALGKDLGLRKIKDVHKPIPGGRFTHPKVKLTPLEHCTWDKIHKQLRAKIDTRMAKLRPGPVKDDKQSFYSGLLLDFHGFREAWRNHVMHTREEFRERDAEYVMSHVDRFIRALATHLQRK